MDDMQKRIIAAAHSWIGTPYCHQASLKHVGCDCLGLVRGVWREVYGAEPELPPAYSASAAFGRDEEILAAAARRHLTEIDCGAMAPGDLVLFRWLPHLAASHAGLLINSTRMIHAQENAAVSEIELSKWWLKRAAFAFRFPSTVQG
jgi:NlpC/P60 family putative phage cell wall peptidase